MKTLNNSTSAVTASYNNLSASTNQLLSYSNNLGEFSNSGLPEKIESFLRNNYSHYDIEQVFVHRNGDQIVGYEIGIDSVYEYTLHFNAQGEFTSIEQIED